MSGGVGFSMPEYPRKRKSTSDEFNFSDDGMLDMPAVTTDATNTANGSNGTLTARAETGSLKIKIRRTGKSPVSTPMNNAAPAPTAAAGTYSAQPTFQPQAAMPFFPPMNPPIGGAFMPMMPMMPMPMPMPMMPMMGLSNMSLSTQSSSSTDALQGNSMPIVDLGPPPSAAPALSVEHSLMGGGIETQNVVNVDTQNFDWNRKTAASPASEPVGRPRSESLPNLGLLDGLSLQRETSFFKEI
ncbi:hypothetical protein ACHHYP_08759 [Achlya hypogyna]|uniref:Uncharacterized protein n=1 Tax=Achlya hypogyna TaxID=1202772 RepID=A0A1V9ZKJ1_ACHHY|nr:hypothetical protein ACHHYP_08759 [Achlya hypogyna]